jgi:hypothetical protein
VLFEYRRYEIAPGRRDEWVEYMETVIIPFQISLGVVVMMQIANDCTKRSTKVIDGKQKSALFRVRS